MPQANSTTSWPRATLAERVGVHLAVLGGDDRGELVLAGVEQLAEGEEHLRAPGKGGVPPGGERGLGRRDRGVALGLAGQRNLAGDLTRRRVRHGRRPAAGRNVAAVDPVLDDVQVILLMRMAWLLRPVCPARSHTIRAGV